MNEDAGQATKRVIASESEAIQPYVRGWIASSQRSSQ